MTACGSGPTTSACSIPGCCSLQRPTTSIRGARRATGRHDPVPEVRSSRWVVFPVSPGVAWPAGNYGVVLHGGPTGNAARRYGDAVTGAERYNSDSYSNGATDPFGTARTGNW